MIKRLKVLSEIQSRFASTDVVADLHNDNAEATEVSFHFHMPKRAFITQFSLYVVDIMKSYFLKI